MNVITIPAYNEEKSIGKVIDDIRKVMHSKKYKIIVVDDGSTDNTAKIANEHGAVVFSHQRNRGLAETFKTEMKECLKLNPKIIVHTDADGQYLAEEIQRLISKVEEGYDLVLGSRFKGKIESMPLIKRIGNKLFSRTISWIAKLKIEDAQTGFRAFTKEVAENVNIISNYTYTHEQIIKAAKQNFKIIEVPVYFAKRDGKSKLMKNPFHYAVRAWINLFRVFRDYEPLKFFVTLGLIPFSLGLITGLYILYNFLTYGAIRHIPLTLLSILLIMMGIQIILFGFLADTQRK